MKSQLFFFFFLVLCMGCNSSNSSPSLSDSQSGPVQLATGPNVIPVQAGSSCGGYVNEPCVTLIICEPGSDRCQSIPRILLDTGSYGLRLFKSVVTLNLPTKTSNSGELAQCVGYLDGTSHWGPVKMADVHMGDDQASNLEIQIIDSNYRTVPPDCTNPETGPDVAGYNGILGVGALIQDCGEPCTSLPQNRIYFSCQGATCNPTSVPISEQVSNPVVFLSQDNNGLIVQMPPIASSGEVSAIGSLVLGIGTRDNNRIANVHVLPADSKGNFKTLFEGRLISTAFIDSGSNAFYFPPTNLLSNCPADSVVSQFFCPSGLTTVSATMEGANGSPFVGVQFQITSAAAIAVADDGKWLFDNLGGPQPSEFDWGLPFFFGRSVHVGIENRTSPLGTGPYWAF
jgi:hypothetical protein